ncbi:MAG: YitT family protein [Erysipelotrichaceae bacterium]|nr:YitT family protein [Erysipelotrichaceae bacterium]
MAVKLFFSEYALTPGGITGFSITLSSILKLPIDIISLCISIPLLIISIFIIGKKFAIKTIFETIMIPICLRIVPTIHIVNNIIGAAILGGILVGISIALALYVNATTGGSDTIAILLNKTIKNISVPTLIFIIDILIVLSSYLISYKLATSLYSALSLLVIILVIKFLMLLNKRRINE